MSNNLNKLNLPKGWEHITPQKLNKYRNELQGGTKIENAEAVDYFDGEAPTWKIAVAENIPRRDAVGKLVTAISEAAAAQRLRVTLLRGPGGEGKSTILQQTVVDLVSGNTGVQVIWHSVRDARLEDSLIRRLPDEQGHFLIVSDDAEVIAGDVYNGVLFLRGQPRVNVQFLLASRTIDWQWAQTPSDADWLRQLGDKGFVRVPIRQLEPGDARRVVKAWEDAGAEGLGDLVEVSENMRAKHLENLAREEANDNPDEGSFLGAMLRARKSITLQGYVERILERLRERPAPNGKTLQDVFAYIAALHADNRQILSRPVLRRLLSDNRYSDSKLTPSRALSCTWENLEEAVISPLADEAKTHAPGWFILVRHRAIAEAAKRILTEKSPLRFEHHVYPDLLRAAREEYLADNGELNGDDIAPWNNLPRFYFSRKQVTLALRLAAVLAEVEPYDPFPVVSWAYIYRDNEQKLEAAELFRQRYHLVTPNKGYFSEWSVSQGQINNHCFSTWLCGIALSDFVSERRSGDTPPMMLLSELTSSFTVLFEKSSDISNDAFSDTANAQTFLKACAAAAQLGLDPKAQKNLKPNFDRSKSERHLAEGRKLGLAKGIPDVHPKDAIDLLVSGINLAWELREKDNGELPDSLPTADTLTFNKFCSLFGVQGRAEVRPLTIHKIPTPRPH